MIPIKDTVQRRTFPFVTVAIIVVNTLAFFLELSLHESIREDFIYLFGLVPARYAHPVWAQFHGFSLDSYWSFLTSLFLHGSWLHLAGNLWFLYLFGDNVEDRLGPVRFFFFYLLAGIGANLVHFLVNHDSTHPVIGASGAIAGVMAAYLRLFPRARIVTLIPILFLPYFIEVPAVLFMGFWFFFQLYSGAASLMVTASAGGIAWWAHVGGFAAGFLLIRTMCSGRPGECRLDKGYYYTYD